MSTVSDGCIAHVSLKANAATVLAASDRKVYEVLEKLMKDSGNPKLINREILEEKKADAAKQEIQKDLSIALHALVNMQKLPELIDSAEPLVIRILLCREAPL